MYDSSLNFPPDGAKIMKVHTYMKSGFLHLEGIIEYCIVRMCTEMLEIIPLENIEYLNRVNLLMHVYAHYEINLRKKLV